ncbi:hypothetical protein BGZ60DRAFT_231118 [Tricladium varicosporioides]|nr:hypothetical protein BGZ60DRAFT_231118 [Hymenoscyphus varicosporioides]
MVYCGKPSKSCRQCRTRNIKCDKKTPSCGQCIRANFTCPGYHNPSSLIIRDQTSSTVSKATTKKPRLLPPDNRTVTLYLKPNCYDEDRLRSITTFENLLYLTPSISVALEHRAKRLFIGHHVFGYDTPIAPVLSYMKMFYPLDLAAERHVIASLRAVSFAYLACNLADSRILWRARQLYSFALRYTNDALKQLKTVKDNTTLLTVLLLDLFEKITDGAGTERDNIYVTEKEGKHLEGALAIVKLRGKEQFSDPVSLRMFIHLSSNILSRSLRRNVDVPEDLISLNRHAEKFINITSLEWRISNLMLSLADLKAHIRKGGTTKSNILQTLTEMVNECSRICTKWEQKGVSPGMNLSNLELVQSTLDTLMLEYCGQAPSYERPTKVQTVETRSFVEFQKVERYFPEQVEPLPPLSKDFGIEVWKQFRIDTIAANEPPIPMGKDSENFRVVSFENSWK